jgi:hypothetical protein
MRHLDRPSARFLGLLHGQAVLRGDTAALNAVEACATERGRRAAVARHSFTYVRRMRALEEMDSFDLDEALEPDPAYLLRQGVVSTETLSSVPHGRS